MKTFIHTACSDRGIEEDSVIAITGKSFKEAVENSKSLREYYKTHPKFDSYKTFYSFVNHLLNKSYVDGDSSLRTDFIDISKICLYYKG